MHYQQLEASIYDKVYAGIQADIPFWQGWHARLRRTDGEALELACGTLRVMLPVAEAGVRVTGMDESPYMLELARKKAGAAARQKCRQRITLAQADMRTFDLGQAIQPDLYSVQHIRAVANGARPTCGAGDGQEASRARRRVCV